MAIDQNRDAQGRDEAMRELAREVGRHSVSQLESGLARVTSESAAVTRWILGALIALNGGAILGLAGAREAFEPDVLKEAVGYLLLGSVAAVLAAFAGALAIMAVSKPIGDAIAQWTQVAVSGEITEDALDAAKRVRSRGLLWQAITVVAGLASLALFLLGTATASEGLGAPAPVETEAAAIPTESGPVTPPPAPVAKAAPPAARNDSPAPAKAARASPAPAPRSSAAPAKRDAAAPPKAPAKSSPSASPRPASPAVVTEKAGQPAPPAGAAKPEPAPATPAP